MHPNNRYPELLHLFPVGFERDGGCRANPLSNVHPLSLALFVSLRYWFTATGTSVAAPVRALLQSGGNPSKICREPNTRHFNSLRVQTFTQPHQHQPLHPEFRCTRNYT